MFVKTNHQIVGEYFYATADYVVTYTVTKKLITIYGADFAPVGQQLCDAKLLVVKEVL